jgi:hypothetical protein
VALSSLKKDQIAERGARMARRDDQAYRPYVREEQRSQPGCPAARWSLFSEDGSRDRWIQAGGISGAGLPGSPPPAAASVRR